MSARVDDRAFLVDAGTIVAGSVAICLASDQLALMTALVPALLVVRFLLWRGPLGPELLFFGVCLALGAFNDWNSVVRHRIYDYAVPVYWPELTTIPVWMLLFWGMILRFFATLAGWERLEPGEVRDEVYLGRRVVRSPWLKVGVLLGIIAVTRQLIYRNFDDPILSWLPFAAALLVYAVLLRPDRHDRRLVVIFLLGGPAVEVLYIQVAGLHQYSLGWLGGVPLWIALWWVLAVLVWKDLAGRIQREIGAFATARLGPAAKESQPASGSTCSCADPEPDVDAPRIWASAQTLSTIGPLPGLG